jgi:hypothetical protein
MDYAGCFSSAIADFGAHPSGSQALSGKGIGQEVLHPAGSRLDLARILLKNLCVQKCFTFFSFFDEE